MLGSVKSLLSTGLFSALVVCCVVVFALPTTTSGLPMKDVISKATETAKQENRHRAKRDATANSCTPSSEADLFQRLQQIDSSISALTFFQRANDNQAKTVNPSDEPIVINLPGTTAADITCVNASETAEAPVEARSVCPFYYQQLVLPEGHYPSTLLSAKCKCPTCSKNNSYGCEEIFTPITVLKADGCFEGLQQYTETIVNVATSCVCAYKASTVAPTTTTTTTEASWGV